LAPEAFKLDTVRPRGDSILADKQIQFFNTVIKHPMMDVCGYCHMLHCILLVCPT